MTHSPPEKVTRLASITWGVQHIRHIDQFFQHMEVLVREASKQGATTILLPELYEVEILTSLPDGDADHVAGHLAPFSDAIDTALKRLAVSVQATIIGGSHLKHSANGIVNVAPIVSPDGEIFYQPKNCRTQWEIEPWGLVCEHGLQSFHDPRLGVLVCYDSEFPEAARALAERGVELLCVPSYSESVLSYQRVNFCSHARAVENEIFVAQACITGPIECFGLGTGYGRSSIMTPSKAPFPDNALLAQSLLNREGMAVADIDFAGLALCRSTGDAKPWRDRKESGWGPILKTKKAKLGF